jgi:hypothetical protein
MKKNKENPVLETFQSNEICNGAWWCESCTNKQGKLCVAGVPYYGSSIYCGQFTEKKLEIPAKQQTTKMNLNKILVNTF